MLRGFILGVVTALLMLAIGGYLFIRNGGLSLATTAKPLPLEETIAKSSLRASIGTAASKANPVPLSDANLLAGVSTYKENCAVCHGVPGRSRTAISKGLLPLPPQLFEKEDMVTDDPEGATYWKVSNGIRLSGMPGFGSSLSENQRWQVSMLLSHADKLPSAAQATLETK